MCNEMTEQLSGGIRRDRIVTYAELKQHCSLRDAWISVNQTVYDITVFLNNHPFGDTFRGHLGTECGGIFSSAHLMVPVEQLLETPEFLHRNGIFLIGVLDVSGDTMHRDHPDSLLERIVYKNTRHDLFWQDLKQAVAEFLKRQHADTHYGFWVGACFLAYYLVIYAVLSYATWVHASHLAAALLGFHMICALAHVSHMATHHGFTRSATLNFIAIHIYDLCGMSGREWQIAHLTHHSQPHSSLDNQTNRYDYMGIRLHESMSYHWWYRYQWVYFWFVVAGYLPYKLIETSLWVWGNLGRFVRWSDAGTHVACRTCIAIQVVFCAQAHGWATGLGLFATYCVSFSYTAFVLLFNNHEGTHALLGKVDDVARFHGELSWAEAQVLTSGNWYPTNWLFSFVEFHYGYFNYHIEHHLFPTLKPPLLKKISPVVREVCEKHGVPYVRTTFYEVQASFQRHIVKLGERGAGPQHL